jgi:hypothetical protein
MARGIRWAGFLRLAEDHRLAATDRVQVPWPVEIASTRVNAQASEIVQAPEILPATGLTLETGLVGVCPRINFQTS